MGDSKWNRDNRGCGKIVRKFSFATLRCTKTVREKGGEGDRAKGMMFLPQCSTGSGRGVKLWFMEAKTLLQLFLEFEAVLRGRRLAKEGVRGQDGFKTSIKAILHWGRYIDSSEEGAELESWGNFCKVLWLKAYRGPRRLQVTVQGEHLKSSHVVGTGWGQQCNSLGNMHSLKLRKKESCS